jgi:repressor LexA
MNEWTREQKPTERQQQILDFIAGFFDEHSYPPTVREIGEAVGLTSPSTTHAHLATMTRLGFLVRDPPGRSHGPCR